MTIKMYPEVPLLQRDFIDQGTGYYPSKYSDFIIGVNTAVNNTHVDLWEGPTGSYVFPATAQQMRVVSTSANDAAAGSNARSVHIHYLDNNYNPQEETITLNGTTPVNTVATNILRINGFHVYTVGTPGISTAGNISLTNTAGTITYGYITAGRNRARQGFFTIPAGKTGYASSWVASSSSTTGSHYAEIVLRATAHANVLLPGVFLAQTQVTIQNSGISDKFDIPIKLPATCDVKVSAISDASNANCNVAAYVVGWFE